MHIRRFITFLLGVWFALVIAIALVPSAGVNVAGQMAKTPPLEPARTLSTLGEPMADQLFRFVASEINRMLLERGAILELLLVVSIACLLFFQNYSRRATIVSGVLLLLVCASTFLLTPQVVAQGRILDFRPADMLMADRARFANLNSMYGILIWCRLLCGAWIAVITLHRGKPLRRRRTDLDMIDNT